MAQNQPIQPLQPLEIDYSGMPPTAPQRQEEEWEPPVHKYFGPKDKNGKMQKEPVYVHQEYPRTFYAKQGNRIVARLVKSDEELKALGKGWEKSPAAFGFIGAPSYEEQQRINAAQEQAAQAQAQATTTAASEI